MRGAKMSNYKASYTDLVVQEIEATPSEYLPTLLNMIRLFRESVTLKPAEDSFRQGWKEVMAEETMPVEILDLFQKPLSQL